LSAHPVDARDHLFQPVIVIQVELVDLRGMNAVEVVLFIEELEPLPVAGVG
jgi:hypothetical protein